MLLLIFLSLLYFISITIAEERLFLSLRSVIIAMHSETLAFEMPPMMRLIRKIRKTLEIDHAKYETSVPNLKNE